MEKAILTLQGTGERFTAENVAKNYFTLQNDYHKLKEIAEMRAKIYSMIKDEIRDGNAWLNSMKNENDKFLYMGSLFFI